jgi:hypothetical protein
MRLNPVNPLLEIATQTKWMKVGKKEPSRVWTVIKKCLLKI